VIPEQTDQQLAEAFGLDKIPENRYSDLPTPNRPTSMAGLIAFKKTFMLVDRLRTASFMHLVDNYPWVIDQGMDAGFWSPEQSWGICCRTDVPPPVNERISNSTDITETRDDQNYFIWLRDKTWEMYQLMGAVAMAPPLVWACGSRKWLKNIKLRAEGAVPLMGIIAKFQLGGPKAQLGAIVPSAQKAGIHPDHAVLVQTPEVVDT
jgi:hypothetical protein